MNTNKTGGNGEAVALWLYDMDIEDVNERIEKRLLFDRTVRAAEFLGMTYSRLLNRIGGVTKKVYAYQKGTNKKYAVRKAYLDN